MSGSESAGVDNEVDITVYDNVGNTRTGSLACTVDNDAPTAPSITGVTESSEYLYYNDPNFYYSNDQSKKDRKSNHP